MRMAAAVLGIVGGLMGITFAQLVMYATAIFGVMAAAFGSTSAGQPLAWSLAALVSYAIGVAGGAVALSRPRPAALILLVAALGGLGATVASGTTAASVLAPNASPRPTATIAPARTAAPTRTLAPPAAGAQTPTPLETYIITAAPFSGPALLLLAALVAFLARTPAQGDRVPAPPSATFQQPATSRRPEFAAPPARAGTPAPATAASPATAPSRAVPDGTREVVLSQTAWLRSEPSYIGGIERSLPTETRLAVILRSGEWLRVESEDGSTGWVHQDSVRTA